jgi:hypothetical protein
VAWAREESLVVNPLDPIIIGQFKDWHLSRGTKLKDFDAAYRKWLRDESKRGNGRGNEGRALTALTRVLAKIGDG